MSCKFPRITKKISIATIMMTLSLQVCAEKYFTWVDESGRVQHTVIKEEPNPLIQTDSNNNAELPPKDSPELTHGIGQSSKKSDASTEAVLEVDSKANIEASDKSPLNVTTPAVTERKTDPEGGRSEYDITVIDEVDYVDGDELEKNNFTRPGEMPRYYTWRDAEGRMVNTPYDGKRKESEATGETSHKILEQSGVAKLSVFEQIPLVQIAASQAEDKALEIMGLSSEQVEGRSQQISNFIGEGCCAELDFEFVSELPQKDEFVVEINRVSRVHIFQSGRSAYELVRLPVVEKDYLIRFRTFINGEAFIPTFIYLDDHFTPLRIVTNISTTFTPENWYRYGYLEGVINAKVNSKSERYMLIITTRASLESNTVFVSEKGKDDIVSHTGLGILELFTIH